MSGLLLAIDMILHPLNSSFQRTGGFGPVNASKFTLTQPDPEKIERISFMRSSRGQALDSYSQAKPTEVEITVDDCQPDIISMAMRGTPANYAQAAGTGVEVNFVARHGQWVALGINNLTALSIPTADEGTDYNVDYEAGLVMALASGGLTNGDSYIATVSNEARSGKTVVSGTVPTLQMAITGHGINLFTQKQVDIEIYQAALSPSGSLDFISNEPVSLTLKGTLVKPASKAGPYAYTEHAAA